MIQSGLPFASTHLSHGTHGVFVGVPLTGSQAMGEVELAPGTNVLRGQVQGLQSY